MVFLFNNLKMALAVADFPLPDSPTMPNVSPALTLKLISLTAYVIVLSDKNRTSKFLTSNITLI